MKEKRTGLGRNLNALLSKNTQPTAETSSDTNGPVLKKLPIDFIQPGKYQPRKHIEPEALQELADSIQAQGILQPIVVRAIGYERYEIIAGERRWRAAQIAKLIEVPVLIYTVSDQTALALALIENIQREDLNPIEEAYALHRLIEEFGFTHQQTAEAVGKSRTNVTNFLRLLQLTSEVKQLLEERKLEMGHARALLTLSPADQLHAAQTIVAQDLSVRETESLVKHYQNSTGNTQKPKKPASKSVLDPNLQHFQNNLSEKLGAKVTIHHQPQGKGVLEIHYNSLDELDGIMEHLN